jgi:hypothetical protein
MTAAWLLRGGTTGAVILDTAPRGITNDGEGRVIPATLARANGTTALDCTNPDPNRQPLDCTMTAPSAYLDDNDTFWENTAGARVARLTRIGNLVINGTLIEHSNGQPGTSDYTIGYTSNNGTNVPSIWVSTSNGDLYLRGALTEANANIPARDRLTPITNRHGLVLALINPRTGDLTLRGNLITNRTITR